MEKNNKPTIKQTFDVVREIREWNGYLNKERFISYAKSKIPISDKQASGFWDVWRSIVELNNYQLEKHSENVIETAALIAYGAYQAVCKGANVRWCENKPRTTKWKVYYQHKNEPIQDIIIDLTEKADVIKYALLLQQEETEIKLRVDYYETVDFGCGNERKHVDIYDGDIIFCTDTEKIFSCDDSGAYLCTGDCYKRLLYTKGRGYIRKGEPDFEQNRDGKDCRYNSHVFSGYDKSFRVVGNIYVDDSILRENNEK